MLFPRVKEEVRVVVRAWTIRDESCFAAQRGVGHFAKSRLWHFWTIQENTVFQDESLIEGYSALAEDYAMEDIKFCSQEKPKLGILILGRGQWAFEKLDF